MKKRIEEKEEYEAEKLLAHVMAPGEGGVVARGLLSLVNIKII